MNLAARMKMTDELWSQIETLYEKSSNIEKKDANNET